MAHVMTFSRVAESKINALKASGCHELFIGIESGSPRILSSIKKTSNVKVILENLTKVLKCGINIKGYFIYGFPGEKEADMEMTYELAVKLSRIAKKHGSRFRTSVFQYRPYHATEIYHDLVSKGEFAPVERIAANSALSDLVGRIQFNFHSGNLSEVDSETVHNYIYRTSNLTDPELFSRIQPRSSPREKEKL
ncbi:Radical SAM domain protein [uncultured Candidatus Thioglobus sp.]|nr:Radical SAM domain protein [uncultured Candidatus Thioglobus sp.]